MDRGTWWAIVHGVTKSQTQLSNTYMCVFVCVCVYVHMHTSPIYIYIYIYIYATCIQRGHFDQNCTGLWIHNKYIWVHLFMHLFISDVLIISRHFSQCLENRCYLQQLPLGSTFNFFFFPLPVRTRPFGRRRSGLGVVGLGEPPEAGPGGPGARGAGSVYGRRPVWEVHLKSLCGLGREFHLSTLCILCLIFLEQSYLYF